jgi:hypothetical protein
MINRFFFQSEDGQYYVFDAQESEWILLPTKSVNPVERWMDALKQYLEIRKIRSVNSVWPFKEDSFGFIEEQTPDKPEPVREDNPFLIIIT